MPKAVAKKKEEKKETPDEKGDVAEFEPKPRNLDDIIEGKEEEFVDEPPEPEKKETPEPEKKEPEAKDLPEEVDLDVDQSLKLKPDDKKEKEPEPEEEELDEKELDDMSPKGLRAAIKTANASKKKALKRVEKLEEDLKAQTDKGAELEKKLEEQGGKFKELSDRVATENPNEAPEVKAILQPFNDSLTATVKSMRRYGEDGKALDASINALVAEYQELEKADKPDWQAFNNKIEAEWPKSAERIFDLVTQGAETLEKAKAKAAEISSNVSEYRSRRAFEQHQKITDLYEQEERNFFRYTADMEQTDPYHPRVVLGKAVQSNAETKALSDKALKLAKFSLLPLAPAKAEELAGMTDEQQSEYLQKRMATHEAGRRTVERTYAEGVVARALLPAYAEELDRLRAELRELRGEDPPDPKEEREEDKQEEDEDLSKFDPGRSRLDLDA